MFLDTTQMPSITTMMFVAASAAATFMLIQSYARQYLPDEVSSYFDQKFKNFIARIYSELTLVIEEYDDGLNRNKLFKAAKLCLEPKIPPNVNRIKINLPKKESEVSLSVEKNQAVVDVFNGVRLKWKFELKPAPDQELCNNGNYMFKDRVPCFELRFHKKHKKTVLGTYIPHILKKSKEINHDTWQSAILDHPSTFDTLAMVTDMKKMIMDDLERFLKRKDYYRRVGKAWKRGYLLFGPLGTGKSSLIAAMANYLHFDVYDLELSSVEGNKHLRKVLIATENKSILVVEDIDCCTELQDRSAQARTASPYWHSPRRLLNFTNGLWSSSGDERIIVFTTNHKDRLDPALLRPGRMDVHIHMSYCTLCGFKILASNYLGITEHPLFSEVEELIEQTKVTPAEVAEYGLFEFLKMKKRDNDEIDAKEANQSAMEAKNIQEPPEETSEGKSQDMIKIH
ncbi:protein HYPER-SENSITIVITY-RELATED 4 [Citrus sinensis]|uniref:Protein HYPER-SENSITIVITY-RELATED 4 n=1 Tax=Citrus sinensis TaxID=2711 RepID=A0ACB8IGZ8_CITSI|nr:protein HYPER-SENSITIVITY-RELATED 4 [Citrus sinensis]